MGALNGRKQANRGRSPRCPSVGPAGQRCAMNRGVDGHDKLLTAGGLGLPRLIHRYRAGDWWHRWTADGEKVKELPAEKVYDYDDNKTEED